MSKMLHVGHTMSIEHGILSSVRLIHQRGGNALQIFTGPADELVINQWPAGEVETVLKIKEKHGTYIVVHGKFLYNFAHDVSAAKWQRDLLIRELKLASVIGADVVIHQGKNVNKVSRIEALRNFVTNLSMVLQSTPDLKNHIILENSAHQGTEMGHTLEEISEIYYMFDPAAQQRIGICWDLCHGFVAGQDLRDAEVAEIHMRKMTSAFRPETHFLVHFNDSNIQLDGKNDNHAPLCCGFIGNEAKGGTDAGFRIIAKLCYEYGIPMIMETGPYNIDAEIAMIKHWISLTS
jgi:deoxyribonuclease-4